MYVPPKFSLSDQQITDALRDAGLAYLVTPNPCGMLVTPLPFLYDSERASLVGHLARANPHWQKIEPGVESVAIYAGPDGYVSPGLYVTKAETGKVVPTWNYEVLNVYGQVSVHDDDDWLRAQVSQLTDHHEASRPQPWAVSDAPESYIAGQLRGIVGVELHISRWEGKAKMSQNQPERNRDNIIKVLASSERSNDRRIAERVAAHVMTE